MNDNKYIASYPDLPARPRTLCAIISIYSARKAGRSGRFCDVMIMSGGRGLPQHGRGWKPECLECRQLQT